LQQGAGLQGEHLGQPPALVQRLDDAERGSAFDGRQSAGVAHGHDAQPVALEQVGTAPAHRLARGDVVVADSQRGLEHRLRPLGQMRGGLVDTPGEVHGGGPGRAQPGDGVLVAVRQRDAERPGHAERGRPAYGQPPDGVDQVRDGLDPHHDVLVR
jgi:hypothetical protein